MARRAGVEQFLRAAAREYGRQQRIAVQQRRADERQAAAVERQNQMRAAAARRERARTAREQERLDREAYVASREAETRAANADLQQQLAQLRGILPHTLLVNDAIDLDSLKLQGEFEPTPIPEALSRPEAQPDIRRFIAGIRQPNRIVAKLFPWIGRRFERELEAAKGQARAELVAWQQREASRIDRLGQAERERDYARSQFLNAKASREAEVDAFAADCRSADPDALVAYFSMVLERSEYPEGFPQNFSIAMQPASRLLVIRYELPGAGIVPDEDEFRYVKSKDAIEAKPRKAADRKTLYADVIAATVLRTVHEVLEADTWRHLDAVAVNGMVKSIDPATGRDIEPCLVSVRATRAEFDQIDLSRVDKAVCLRNLGAQVSRSPEEVQAVKPIVEFNMSDPRFVDQSDLVSELSSASNLMELNPFEFEQLVANLFGKMGLESKLTRSSRDGGVDCVAFDPRPVLGGKVVIQAKRYRNTVGVSAVRDLYGTMMNEGASKGLLVTTSGYGPDAFQFAKDKPIELIDGGGLLYLLTEIGVHARIQMPDDGAGGA